MEIAQRGTKRPASELAIEDTATDAAGSAPALQFVVVTTQRELAKPDCDGKFLVERFKESGSRCFDFENEEHKQQLRQLFRQHSHTAVARALSGTPEFASLKLSRQRAAANASDTIAQFPSVNGGQPLSPALVDLCSRHPLEVERLRVALIELAAAKAAEAAQDAKQDTARAKATLSKPRAHRSAKVRNLDAQTAPKPRRSAFKAENVRLRLRDLRQAMHDEAAMSEVTNGPAVSDGRIVLVMFPCTKMGSEIAENCTHTAWDGRCLRPEEIRRLTGSKLTIREFVIVLIDETWPKARKIFYEIVGESFDPDDGGYDDINEGVREFFTPAEWANVCGAVDRSAGQGFNRAFERHAMVIKTGEEPAERRQRYHQISNFGRKQEMEDVGVCTLEAAVRLAELIGGLSSEERNAAQLALDAYLADKPVGTTALSSKSDRQQ